MNDAAAPISPVPGPASERTFAFLVHPRASVGPDMARVWPPLGWVPEPVWQWTMRHAPLAPMSLATVYREGGPAATSTLAGHVIVVPVGAKQILTEPRRWVRGKIEAAIDEAERRGASVVGLGALTAPVTGAGRLLRSRPGIALTTGNAFTAYLTHEALHRLRPAARGGHLAIIGATGSVGSCVVRMLADEPIGADLTLVARDSRRLEALADEVRGGGTSVRTSTDLAAARDADVVLVLTSATDALIRSEHLRRGAIVLDDTQPRNTDPALAAERPDVLVVDGGVADVSGLDIRGDIGLPRGLAYACLCETMLMAFDGIGTDAVGQADVGHALRLRDAARRFAHLGFTLADPALSFGRPVPWPQAVPSSADGDHAELAELASEGER